METKTVLTKINVNQSRLIGDASISFENDQYKAIFVRPIKDERDWSLEVYRKGDSKPFQTICVARNLEEIAFIKDAILNVLFENNLIDLYVIGNKGIEKLDNEI